MASHASDPSQLEQLETAFRAVRPVGSDIAAGPWVVEDAVGATWLVKRDAEAGGKPLQAPHERAILQTLDHPHIVAPGYPSELEDVSGVFARAWVDGIALGQRVVRGRFEVEEALGLAHDVLDALTALHDIGLAHGRLDAGHVLLDEGASGTVKLIGLGLIAPSAQTEPVHSTRTPVHPAIAPEQIRRDPWDARADIYALGVLLYLCLAGRYPQSIARERGTPREIPRLDTVDGLEDLPPELVTAVHQMLATNPADRPSDTRAVQEALGRVRNPEPVTATIAVGGPTQVVAVEAPRAFFSLEARPEGDVGHDDASTASDDAEPLAPLTRLRADSAGKPAQAPVDEDEVDDHGVDDHGVDDHGVDDHGVDDHGVDEDEVDEDEDEGTEATEAALTTHELLQPLADGTFDDAASPDDATVSSEVDATIDDSAMEPTVADDGDDDDDDDLPDEQLPTQRGDGFVAIDRDHDAGLPPPSVDAFDVEDPSHLTLVPQTDEIPFDQLISLNGNHLDDDDQDDDDDEEREIGIESAPAMFAELGDILDDALGSEDAMRALVRTLEPEDALDDQHTGTDESDVAQFTTNQPHASLDGRGLMPGSQTDEAELDTEEAPRIGPGFDSGDVPRRDLEPPEEISGSFSSFFGRSFSDTDPPGQAPTTTPPPITPPPVSDLRRRLDPTGSSEAGPAMPIPTVAPPPPQRDWMAPMVITAAVVLIVGTWVSMQMGTDPDAGTTPRIAADIAPSEVVAARPAAPAPAPPAAYARLQTAAGLGSDDFRAGLRFADSDETAKALERFMASYARQPDASTVLNIGIAYQELGALDAAREWYETLLETFPDRRDEATARLNALDEG